MTQFYTALPRLFPRVKAVCWLSMNAIEHAMPGRQKNDYSLLNSAPKAALYRELTGSPYFLKDYRKEAAPVEVVPLSGANMVNGIVRLSAWAKTWDDRTTIVWSLNGKEVSRTRGPSPAKWDLDTVDIKTNRATIGLAVLDAQGRVTARASEIVYVRRPPGVQGPQNKKKAPGKG